jgi:predicted peptidase
MPLWLDRVRDRAHRPRASHARSRGKHQGLPFLLYTPRRQRPPFPLIIFLHGLGEVGGALDGLTVHSLPHLADSDRLPHVVERRFPFMIVCPHTASRAWSPTFESLQDLIGDLADYYGADRERCYVTGMSLGAIGTWKFASRADARVSAILPVSGPAPAASDATRATPAWVFAGELDRFYPAAEVERDLFAVRNQDDRTKFTCCRGADHTQDTWNAIYARSDIYGWLLTHRSPAADRGS